MTRASDIKIKSSDVIAKKICGGIWQVSVSIKTPEGVVEIKRIYEGFGYTARQIVSDFVRGVESGEYLDGGEL